MDHKVLMIEVLDCHREPPTVATRFWWSAERGVTSDKPWILGMFGRDGIHFWHDGKETTVYPRDGRPFFDALPVHFSGLWSASEPTVVESQEGSAEP